MNDGVSLEPGVPDALGAVLWDPQTSGGLLFAIAADRVDDFRQAFETDAVPVWEIGNVNDGAGVLVGA
jgi:selenide,water dikinase